MLYNYQPSSYLGKCGNDCGKCPLNKDNLLTEEDRINTAKGCSVYINWNPSPDKLKKCMGCQSQKGFLYLPNCRIRNCAFHNEIKNCAYCSEFPCEDSPRFDVKKVEDKIGSRIPQDAYNLFVGPWTSTDILMEIRSHLKSDQVLPIKPITVDLKIVDFPRHLAMEEEEIETYRSIHKLITKVEPLKNLSYARVEVLKETRKYYLRLLWAFGIYSDMIDDDKSTILQLNSKDYFSEMSKTRHYSYKNVIEKRFEHLTKFGVHLKIVPDNKLEDIITPKNGIRKQGWKLTMAFDDKLHDIRGLQALKNLTIKLHGKHGIKGYTLFAKADMRILEND